jgi:hypothetical protein
MSSGGGQTTTQTSNNAPWSGAQPALGTALTAAQNEFAQGAPAYYPGQTVAGFNDLQNTGINNAASKAMSADPLQTQGMGALGSALNPTNAPGYNQTANVAQGGQTNPFLGGIETMSQGGQNPYLDATFKQGANQIQNATDTTFARAGRGLNGGGAYADTLTRSLGDYATNLYGGAYENDQNRQLSALGLGAQTANQDTANQTNAFGQLSGIQNQQNQTGLNGVNALNGFQDYGYGNDNRLMDLGSQLQQQQQTDINANIDRYNYGQNADRSNIEWLNAIASGQGSLGGTSTSTGANPNYRSATQNLLGLGGSLASAFMMSDRRLKTDIVALGTDEFGQPWYSYRYKWDAPYVKRVGVMADEMPAHAVRRMPNGFDAVDYATLAEAA